MQSSPSKTIDLDEKKGKTGSRTIKSGEYKSGAGINITPVGESNITDKRQDPAQSDHNDPDYVRGKRVANIGNQIEKNKRNGSRFKDS